MGNQKSTNPFVIFAQVSICFLFKLSHLLEFGFLFLLNRKKIYF